MAGGLPSRTVQLRRKKRPLHTTQAKFAGDMNGWTHRQNKREQFHEVL
ncbi:hypothetical protein OOU_Y34scaffold00745g105 [Pyricularia oryzae Y34]|uniref:Uncharacterized protein n=3 Tax=Pyricularia oryzae TaxID=318829 RepID=A0A4P7N927_PYROR|nr:hypothetical protein OOU_Y34scaffold00745g105 [Pyricularia oryzae Y34]QBZ59237.1 hypothetical protein PoMZ_04198 [Pyricularia oryzae]